MENNQLHNNMQETQPEETGFDLTLFLLECLAHWKWFLVSFVIVLGAAVFYTMRQVPTYNIESLVLIVDKWSKTDSDVLTQSLGITSGADNIFTEIEMMRSRSLVKKVVDDLDLYASYSIKGRMRNTPLYNNTPFVIVPDSTTDVNQLQTTVNFTIHPPRDNGEYDIEVKYTFENEPKEMKFTTAQFPFVAYLPAVGTFNIEMLSGYDPIEKDLLATIKNPKDVATGIAAGLNIMQPEKNAMMLKISYNTPIVKLGEDIINRVFHYYNEAAIDETNKAARNTEVFINNRLLAIQKELSSVESEVERYRSERGLTDISSESEIYLRQTSESDKVRSELDVQLNLVSYVESFLSNPENTFSPIPSLGITEPELRSVIGDYNKAIAEREKLLSTSSEDNPVVQEFTRGIRALRANVLQGVAATRKGIDLKKKDLVRQDEEIERKIRNVPQYERELTDIMRQQRIKENLFVFLLEKREENALTQTLAVGDARMIDEPTSKGIVAPRKSFIFFAAFIIALLIPGCIVFFKQLIFPVFRDRVELETLTNIPVLTELPHCNIDEFFVVKPKSNSPAAELFRLLRNNIQFVFSSPDKKVVLVTSSVSKEGKTFISANLAISFALTGKKVLCVGLDIRRPRLAHHFDLSNRKGITNYLSGQETDIDAIIVPTHIDNLDILPGGPVPPNPNELLLNTALDTLFAELRNRYDYIIIDSAPVGLVSDSFLINRVADASLFVTRAGYTSRSHIKTLNSIAGSGKLSSVYLCINDVDMTSRSYSYRKYGYSYGTSTYGSYGYNDAENDKKKHRFLGLFRK